MLTEGHEMQGVFWIFNLSKYVLCDNQQQSQYHIMWGGQQILRGHPD